jgi:GntR family transcriptional regulator
MIGLTIDKKNLLPIYAQIMRQIEGSISTGRLKSGDPLPSIRELAAALLINPNTVARAYRELEGIHLVVTERGKGCFIADLPAVSERKWDLDELNVLMDEVVQKSKELGIDLDELQRLFEQRADISKDKDKGEPYE